MKRTCLVFCMIGIIISLAADERRDKYDFFPPEPVESPVFPLKDDRIDIRTGLIVSSVGTVLGAAATLTAMQRTAERAIDDTDGVEVHRNIALTGTSLVGTAIFTIMLDHFINKIKKESISEE